MSLQITSACEERNPLITVFLAVVAVMVFSSPAPAGDEAVAKVNGVPITAADLAAEIDRLVPRAMFHDNVTEEKRSMFREKALNSLIDGELQYQDAVAKGLKPDKKAIKEQMEQIRGRFKTKREFKTALAQAGLTEDALEARVVRALLVQSAVQMAVLGPAQMNDAELKDYYDKNTLKFKQPERVRMRLVSVSDEKKAAQALAKVKAGEDFGKVASEYSEDQYRVLGGELGYQHRGKLLPEIENAAFSLKPGELSGLIKAKDLWFFIMVEDKKPEQQMSFDESKDKLKQELETKRARELNEKWMAELKAKARIEVLLTSTIENDKGQATKETTTQRPREKQ